MIGQDFAKKRKNSGNRKIPAVGYCRVVCMPVVVLFEIAAAQTVGAPYEGVVLYVNTQYRPLC